MVKLIDHVRGNDELDIILNEGVDGHGMDNHGKLTRLKLALKFNEKQVDLSLYLRLYSSHMLSWIAPLDVSIILIMCNHNSTDNYFM